MRLAALLSAALLLGSCGGPTTDTKRLVARCVQETARVLQEYYNRPHVVSSAHGTAPIGDILKEAALRRRVDLERLSDSHRVLVEQKMSELARWINARTRVSAAEGVGPLAGAGVGSTTIDLPSAADLNEKAKSLCIEAFNEW